MEVIKPKSIDSKCLDIINKKYNNLLNQNLNCILMLRIEYIDFYFYIFDYNILVFSKYFFIIDDFYYTKFKNNKTFDEYNRYFKYEFICDCISDIFTQNIDDLTKIKKIIKMLNNNVF